MYGGSYREGCLYSQVPPCKTRHVFTVCIVSYREGRGCLVTPPCKIRTPYAHGVSHREGVLCVSHGAGATEDWRTQTDISPSTTDISQCTVETEDGEHGQPPAETRKPAKGYTLPDITLSLYIPLLGAFSACLHTRLCRPLHLPQ
jgi:hypothetical protein